MNPLSENPNIFCNGEFQIKIDDGIHGEFIDKFTYHYLQTVLARTSYCTLIARPIEDLSDEEIKEVYDQLNWDKEDCRQMRKFLITRAGSGNMKLDMALKLSDKGVYPGPQSHFGDTVIDSRTLKTTA